MFYAWLMAALSGQGLPQHYLTKALKATQFLNPCTLSAKQAAKVVAASDTFGIKTDEIEA
jgi:hypothetical protein